jgi:DNA topoisomerase-1
LAIAVRKPKGLAGGKTVRHMTRLRRSDCSGPGIARRRRGRGFEYRDSDGHRVDDPEDLARIRELGIPPAWKEVWICPAPTGHLQATGVDDAGRKQYLYHPQWRVRRDAEKFADMVRFAHALPDLRERVQADLAGDGFERTRVLACAVRLLDRGFFRIGSEEYAEQNESFGLATMRKSHVTIGPNGAMDFDYPAKSGQRRVQALVDPQASAIVAALKRRRGGGEELLAFKDGRRWRDVRSVDINAYIKELTGEGFSAKDFRTWNATVLAAVALGVSGEVAGTETGRKRAIVRAVKEVAHYLGNTPAVCRASYIDPRVFDAYRGGLVIHPALHEAAEGEPGELPIHQRAVEEAVLDLINERERSRALERVAA